MIPEQKLAEFRKYLDASKNPLFIFDNDPDGLSAFLLLWKYCKKGKWLAYSHTLRVGQALMGEVEVLDPDLVVLLDMPVIDQEFIDMLQIPVLHLDHHPPINIKGSHYHYYNPRVYKDEDNRPTTYWAYRITQQNLWVGMVGMVSDWFVPEYTKDFSKKFPDLIPAKPKGPGEAYFETELGKLAKIFAFCLKGKKEDTQKCIKALMMIESPYEILQNETPQGRFITKYTDKFHKKYNAILEEAMEAETDDKVFLFTYPYTEHSFSSLLSTELIHRRPKKIVIVARVKDFETIMSIRSRKLIIPPILEQALDGLEGYGGGHDHACGCKIKNEDFLTFIHNFRELVEKAK